MKNKLNTIDAILILLSFVLLLTVCLISFTRFFDENYDASVTFLMTDNVDECAKYIKTGDALYFEDGGSVGSVTSVKAADGGLAITVSTHITKRGESFIANGYALKYGKSYVFYTRRITGSAICQTIEGASK